MTQDEIVAMAREADLDFLLGDNWMLHHELLAFARLVAEKATEEANARANASWELMCKKMVSFEREACAKVCETHGVHVALNVWNGGPDWYKHGKECAAAIRARGEA